MTSKTLRNTLANSHYLVPPPYEELSKFQRNDYMSLRAGGDAPPWVWGASGRRFGALFRGFVFVLFRPSHRRFRFLLLRFFVSRRFLSSRVCGGFVSTFLALRLALGLIAVAVVSHRLFLVSRLVLGLLFCGGPAFVFSYSSVCHTAPALLN